MAASVPPRIIVVGFDGSAHAREAVRWAVRLVQGGRIVLVHARFAPPPNMTARWQELLASGDGPTREALHAVAQDEIPELAGVDWESRVVDGSPAEAIVAVAREVGAEMIAVGSRGYGAAPSLGSVSTALVRLADRPVVVIPAHMARG